MKVSAADWLRRGGSKPIFYLFALPFMLGLVAGFQGVWERFKYDSFRALKTLPGTAYLLARGAVPAGLFAALYFNHLVSSSPWSYAAGCGLGSEALLRTKLYIKADPQGGDVYKGAFDAVKWYQDRCLEAAARTLAQRRKGFVDSSMRKQASFPVLHAKVTQNIQNFDPALLARKVEDLRKDIDDLKLGYAAQLAHQGNPGLSREELDLAFRIQLGYIILKDVNQSRTSYWTLIG